MESNSSNVSLVCRFPNKNSHIGVPIWRGVVDA